MALKLKRDAETNAPIITDDEKFVYIDDKDNSEIPLDPAKMYDKIGELGRENQGHRTRFQEAESKLKHFDGIEDLTEWKKTADSALETVANFNDKDWMKADKVDALKKEMKESYDAQLSAKDQTISEINAANQNIIAGKDASIRKLMVSNRFATSPYFTGEKPKTTLPVDIGEAYFGNHFKVEEVSGNPVLRAYHDAGTFKEQINSKVNPGEPAGFEEALGILIEKYPGKDSILTASGPGTGSRGGKGQGGGDHDDLSALKEEHKKAVAEGRSQDAISLKNRIFALQQKLRTQG